MTSPVGWIVTVGTGAPLRSVMGRLRAASPLRVAEPRGRDHARSSYGNIGHCARPRPSAGCRGSPRSRCPRGSVSGAAPRPSAPGRRRSGTAARDSRAISSPRSSNAATRSALSSRLASTRPCRAPARRSSSTRVDRGIHLARRATTLGDQALLAGLVGTHRAAGEEPVGCRARAEPGPQRDRDHGGRQAEAHLGEGEGHVVAADHDVGTRRPGPGRRRAPARRAGRPPAPAGRRWRAAGR